MTEVAHAPLPVYPPLTARRPRRWSVLALVALVLGSGVAYTAAHSTHEPLEQGAGIFAFGVADDVFRLTPEQTVRNAFGANFRVTAPAVGTRVGIAFGLHNSGRSDVEVLAVGSPLPPYYLGATEAFVSEARGGTGLPYRALRPFRLAAGGQRDVGVTVVLRGCPDGPITRNGGTLVIDRVPVTWRWLGRTRVSEVPLDFRGSLDAMPVCAG